MTTMQRAIHNNIVSHGLHVQYVFPCQPGDKEFAYTIGLSAKYGYELIVFGLPAMGAVHILNTIALSLADEPLLFDTPIDDFTNLPVLFKRCDPALLGTHVQQAFNYYRRDDVPFVQMVLCDKRGRFPDSPLFDHAYMDQRQILLYPTTH